MNLSFLRKSVFSGALMLLTLGARTTLLAQAGRGAATAPPTAKAAAPIDLTGYWVAVITEDWRWRMVTPAKGDYASIPITPEAKKAGDLWDPAKDEAAGEQCKSYGAPALMRIPGRLHITWQDDNTLKVEVDAGTQTRLLHFGDGKASQGAPTWQGDSLARWETPQAQAGGNGNAQVTASPKSGDLKVVTNHLRPGYLRKNGVPYSGNALLTEYWDLMTERHLSAAHNGEQWIVITTIVADPQYLQIPWITTLHFRKEADGAKWDPQSCSARW
jgi:hypothetical protein